MKHHNETTYSEVIEMAWCDKTSFDDIADQLSLSEKEIIAIMRGHMKPSSFRMWRKRVSGQKAKHRHKSRHEAPMNRSKNAK